ncbi:MAG: hypothetical protein QOF73_1943 [Thermomicrobiales bacterium]|jgi:uncharacterized protein (DUF433 family)|nr:hypothetical protein [Thermomicrobiales bacterium]
MADTQVREIASLLSMSESEADELIARYIRNDPHRHGRDRVRTGSDDRSIPVWLAISYLRGADENAAAAAYDLSTEAILAAIAYYRRHRALIDARILLQDEQFVSS